MSKSFTAYWYDLLFSNKSFISLLEKHVFNMYAICLLFMKKFVIILIFIIIAINIQSIKYKTKE
jgi:hypothetical protein